jgi:hypothetical protein
MEISRLFIRYGADPARLSFMNAYANYAKNDSLLSEHREYLKFLVRELNLNPNELDDSGRGALSIFSQASDFRA